MPLRTDDHEGAARVAADAFVDDPGWCAVGPTRERRHQPARLVDPEVDTALVAYLDRALAAAELDLAVEVLGAGGRVDYGDPRPAVQGPSLRAAPAEP